MNNSEAKFANEMKSAVADQALAIRNLVLLTNATAMARESARLEKQRKVYADADDALGRMFSVEPGTIARERSLYAEITANGAVAAPLMAKAAALRTANDPMDATRVRMEEAWPKQAVWLKHLGDLADFEDQLNAQSSDEATTAYHSVLVMVWTIVALSLVVGVSMALLIKRGILKQLGGEPAQAQEMARQIAAGNLSQKIHVSLNDSNTITPIASNVFKHIVKIRYMIRLVAMQMRGRRRASGLPVVDDHETN